MLVTNQTAQDYWFGPLHLDGGVGQTLTVDDTTETSLYLTSDTVADAINYLYISGKITVSSAASPFPRPTGIPELHHGDGSPEGLVYAPEGSLYMRRDGTGPNSLYTKTTGTTINTGWTVFNTGSGGTTYRKTTAKAVTNTVSETDLLNGEITIAANVLGTTNVARLTAWGDWVQNSGGTQGPPRFKLKLGATPTVVLDTGASGSSAASAASATRYGWRITCEILNLGATNSQWVTLALSLTYQNYAGASVAAITTGEGNYMTFGTGLAIAEGGNSAAIDTTAAMNVLLSVINPTATATCETKLLGALVEII